MQDSDIDAVLAYRTEPGDTDEARAIAHLAKRVIEDLTEDRENLRREIGTLRRQLDNEPAAITAAHERIVELEKERDEKAALCGETLLALDNARDDLGTIAEALRDEAMERDWCSEYGRFVDRVNARTHGDWLRPCKVTVFRQFVVEVVLTAETNSDAEDAVELLTARWSNNDDIGGAEQVTVRARPYEGHR